MKNFFEILREFSTVLLGVLVFLSPFLPFYAITYFTFETYRKMDCVPTTRTAVVCHISGKRWFSKDQEILKSDIIKARLEHIDLFKKYPWPDPAFLFHQEVLQLETHQGDIPLIVKENRQFKGFSKTYLAERDRLNNYIRSNETNFNLMPMPMPKESEFPIWAYVAIGIYYIVLIALFRKFVFVKPN